MTKRIRVLARATSGAALLSLGLLTVGCSEMGGGMGSDFSGLGSTGMKRQNMCAKNDVTSQEALEIGRRVLAKQGFRLKSVDSDQLRIETQPTEQSVRGGEGRIRDSVVKMPNRVRRTATLEFSTRGEDLQAWCQVKIERLETADFRVFQQQRNSEDAPLQTPIDREAATTAKQNTVWSGAGRDESMEREILADLHDRIQAYKTAKEGKKAATTEPAK